jgi:WD40 repeat protein
MARRKPRKPTAPAPDSPDNGPPFPHDPLPEGARVRLGTNRLNHVVQGGNSGVCKLAFSTDGHYLLALGYQDDEGTLWELPGVREVWRRDLGCGIDRGAGVAFSPDGRYVVIGNRNVKVFEVTTGHDIRTLRADWPSTHDLVFSPCGRYLAEARGGRVDVRAVGGWKTVATLQPEPATDSTEGDNFRAVAFSPDGRLLAAGSARWKEGGTFIGRAWVWEWQAGTLVNRMGGPKGAVNAVHFLPDGRLAGCSDDETVRVWDVASGREERCHRWSDKSDNPFPAAFRPDGMAVALPESSGHGPTLVLDPDTGAELGRYPHTYFPAWSPDGRTLVTAECGRCTLWDTETGTGSAPPGRHLGDCGGPDMIAFSADGWRVLTVGLDRDGFVWDAGTGRLVATLPPELAVNTRGIFVSPDGRSVVAHHEELRNRRDGGPKAPHLYVWEVDSGRVRNFPLPAGVPGIAWAGDGWGVCVPKPDGGLARRPLGRAAIRITRDPAAPRVMELRGLADGRVLGLAAERVCAWDTTGRLAAQADLPGLTTDWPGYLLAYTPGGRAAAVYRAEEVGIVVGVHLRPLNPERAGSDPVAPVSFTIPEGFGRASFNGLGVTAAFLADGRLLVAACRGSREAGGPFVVKVWEAAAGLEVWESPVFPCAISELMFAPDGRTLAVALDDATTVLFDIPPRPLVVNPAWLTSTVVQLARGISRERASDRLPVLADALEDAGCDDPDILHLCRRDPVRGHWVVELIRGKR